MTRVNVCRICTKQISTTNFVSLFDNESKILLVKINLITGMELQDKKDMPKYICKHCNFDLELAYKFRECCIESQKYFETNLPEDTKDNVLNIDDIIESAVDETNNEEYGFIVEQIMSDTDEIITEQEQIDSEEFIVSDNEIATINEQNFNPIGNENTNDLVEHDDSNESKPFALTDYQMEYESFHNNLIKIEDEDDDDDDEDIDGSLQTINPVINIVKDKKIAKPLKKKTIIKRNKVRESAPFICDQCGDKFQTRHYFITHLQRHKGEKPYQCEICQVKFYTNGQLHRHMRVHTGVRPYACKHCNRTFTDYSTRVRHERTHTNERPYKCPQCDKAFGISFVLKNHMLTHTGEKSFRCLPCNKAFALKSHLSNHLRTLIHKQNEKVMNRDSEIK